MISIPGSAAIGVAVFAGLWTLVRLLRRFISLTNIETITIDKVIRFESKKNSRFKRWDNALEEILKRPRPPKALIVRINSPGGTIGASQELHSTLMRIRAKGITVVALLEDVAASGGFYVALAADYIVANAGTITGSIGAIIQGYEYSQVLEWLQVKVQTIKAGQFKDLLSPTRSMTDGERELLQSIVGDTHNQFVRAVAGGRHLPLESVWQFADGRILSGSQAREVGLVDEIGGFDRALAAAMRLAKIPSGRERIGTIGEEKSHLLGSLLEKLPLQESLNSLLPNTELSGLPLWLMPGSDDLRG